MPNAALHEVRARLDVSLALSDLVDETAKRLAQQNDPAKGTPTCFLRDGKIVRVHLDEHHRPRAVQIAESGLKVEIDRIVEFYAVRGKEHNEVTVWPPDDVVRGVLSLRAIGLPKLVGITESPVLRPDGTVLDAPGYDRATGLYYYVPDDAVATIPRVPDAPTDEQVREAFAAFAEVLWDFPFHGDADRANAYAMVLTPVVRPAIRGHVPLGGIDAPKQGNGKSLIGEVIAVVQTGRTEGSITEAKDDEEWRKKITSVLQIGRTVAVIDNVRRDLDSGQLASLLTKDTWEDRLLGKNELASYPAVTTWLATGNNLRFGGDMVRRVYRVRLDAKQARPWTRGESSYRHPDLLAYVEERRPALLAAALTIGRAWFARGCPQASGVPAFASFNAWAKALGGMLALGGVGGFLANLTELWDVADDEAGEWEPFLRAWARIFSDTPVTAQAVYKRCIGHTDDGMDLSDEVMALRASLPGNLADDLSKQGSFTKKLGWALKHHTDARYGDAGYRIEFAGKDQHTNTALWRVLHDHASCGFPAGFDPSHNGHARLGATPDLAPYEPVNSEGA